MCAWVVGLVLGGGLGVSFSNLAEPLGVPGLVQVDLGGIDEIATVPRVPRMIRWPARERERARETERARQRERERVVSGQGERARERERAGV